MTEAEAVKEAAKSTWPAIHQAAVAGNVEEVKKLLDEGADINERERIVAGYTPLAAAVSYGQIEAVRLLLERGADVNAGNNYVTPLHIAEIHNHNEIAELLRQHQGESFATPTPRRK